VFSVLSNRRLESGADLRLTPTADWNEGSVTVAVRVRVLDGSGTSIGLGTEQGTWEVTLAEDEWVVRNDAEIEHFLKATLGEWVTVKFVVREVRNPNVRGERRCTIHVDDTQLMDNGSLNGRFEHFYVSAGGSTVVVGGAELIRR
jgi:hypothetical protein